ncbi:MAG TPA: response regulator [Planctomycetota bacterium]|nr:response regulator [Planctomycetota bacterium]
MDGSDPKEPGPGSGAQGAGADGEVRPRVLVVDDEESVRFFLLKTLRKEGYEVEAVASGRAAVDRIAKAAFDVVLTDIVMPDVSGLDVLKAVHEMDKDAVVILMTAHGSVENAIDALHLGAFDYLLKPFETKELLVRITRGLAQRTVERENRKLRFFVSKQLAEGSKEDGLASARREWERGYIEDLLRQTHGNVTKAAELAHISRPNLHKKLRALGVDPHGFKR